MIGRLLSDYDMDNTILLETRKIKAVAMGMKSCIYDLDAHIVSPIGQVILDYLEKINNHIENDCIMKKETNHDQNKGSAMKIKALMYLLNLSDFEKIEKDALGFYLDVVTDLSDEMV